MRILSSKSWISTALALVGAILIAGYPAPSQAVVEIVVQEQGSDVVFNASGTLDLSGLSKSTDHTGCYGVIGPSGASAPFVTVGPDSGNVVPCDGYSGTINGPTSFGSGTQVGASSGGTTEVGLYTNASQVIVPDGYTSGGAISGSCTYSGQSFSSLGLTAGTYTWTWGSGSNEDSLILRIGAPIPTLNEWAMILLSILLVGAGVIVLRRRGGNGRLAK